MHRSALRFGQPANGRSHWSKAKPFSISKRVVFEAYKRVKANKGAAGVDGESIADFEEGFKEQSLQDLESHVFGQLFSASGTIG